VGNGSLNRAPIRSNGLPYSMRPSRSLAVNQLAVFR
jgi:hypothetical protein